MHVDNLLANFIANCSDEDERENENTSSCPVITSDTNILIPDTCQNDIIPFNLDQQESNKNVIPSETFEKDYQQILDKSSDVDECENENTSSCPIITSDTNILIPDTCQNDIIPFNLDQQESNNENVIPSKTFEKDYQQILDKSPYIHLTDIATPEKIISFESNHLYGHFKESDSSFHIPNHGIVKDHKVSTASNQSLCESVHSDSQMVENVNNEIRDTNLQNHISYQNNLDHSTFNLNETFQQINTSNKHFSTNKKETRKRAALSDENCTNTDSLGLKTPSTKRRKKLIKNKRSTIDKNPSSQTVDEINYTKSPHKEVDSNMQLNGLSTLLANHGDISIQESEIMNENISSVKKSVCSKSISDSVSDHSESLLPQFLNSTFQEKSNILNNENDIQRPINNISSISLVNDKNHYNDPLMNLDYGNNVTNSVLNACNSEELENACKLSKNQDPEDNSLNSVRLTIETTDNINESACTENEPNCNSFKTTASLTPIDFNSISNLKLSEQHNQRHLIPVASSSPQAGSDISQSPFVHYTNNDHSLIQNSQNTYNASVGHNKEHIFTTNVDLTSDKSNCIIDCKIINESNVTDKSVNMGTSTIKVILNLSCIKPENTSNTHMPENHFSSHCGPSVGIPSVTSGQSNYSVSFPQHNCYFDEPPILTREVNELYTPPVSEHQMSIEIPLSSSKETAHLNKNTNSTSSCLKNKSLTKNSSNEMNSTNLFSNSVNDTNEWNINPLDLNSSFSLISPFRTKDQVNNILKSLDLPGMENNSRPSTNNKSNDSTFKKSDMCSKIPNKKSQKNNSYRNSINSIYSEESEDDISVSTLSIYSGEETDHSFINTTDDEMPSNILKKRKDNSLKNAKKNLFQSFSSSAAFQASTADSSADEETETIEQPTKGSKQQNETLTTSLNHSYNLRSRKSLVKPR